MFGVSFAIVKSTLLFGKPYGKSALGNSGFLGLSDFGHPGEVRHMVFDEADTLCETWPRSQRSRIRCFRTEVGYCSINADGLFFRGYI